MAYSKREAEYEAKFLTLKIQTLGRESLSKGEREFYAYVMDKGSCHVCGSGGTDDLQIGIQDVGD